MAALIAAMFIGFVLPGVGDCYSLYQNTSAKNFYHGQAVFAKSSWHSFTLPPFSAVTRPGSVASM